MMATTIYTWLVAAMLFLQPAVHDHTKLARKMATVIATEPALFQEDDARHQTTELIVAMAFRESSFRHGVVSATNDHCEMQINGRADLDDDIEKCFREAFKMLRASFHACPSAPLAIYVGGGCSNDRARRISNDRIYLAAKLHAAIEWAVTP